MSKKINIEELLKQKFESYEASVPKSAWEVVKANSNFGSIAQPASTAISGNTSGFAAGIIGGIAVSAITLLSPSFIQNQINQNRLVVDQYPTPTTITTEKTNELAEKIESKSVEVQSTESVQPNGVDHSQTTDLPKLNQTAISSESSKEVSSSDYDQSQSTKSVVPVAESTVDQTVEASFKSTIKATPVGGKVPLEVAFNAPEGVVKSVWDFGDGTPKVESLSASHQYDESGSYTVTMIAQKEDGKFFMDKISVRAEEVPSSTVIEEQVEQEESIVKAPNIFTPNGDGINDEFHVEASHLREFEIRVFNPGGQEVFVSNDPSFKWDGQDMSGALCPEGLYFYQIKAVGEDSKIHAVKGSLTIRK